LYINTQLVNAARVRRLNFWDTSIANALKENHSGILKHRYGWDEAVIANLWLCVAELRRQLHLARRAAVAEYMAAVTAVMLTAENTE
jgi:hypothetical protein